MATVVDFGSQSRVPDSYLTFVKKTLPESRVNPTMTSIVFFLTIWLLKTDFRLKVESSKSTSMSKSDKKKSPKNKSPSHRIPSQHNGFSIQLKERRVQKVWH